MSVGDDIILINVIDDGKHQDRFTIAPTDFWTLVTIVRKFRRARDTIEAPTLPLPDAAE